MATDAKGPQVARVDQVIDENGVPMALPEDSTLQATHDVERAIGSTGPSNWWQLALIGIGIVAAILLGFQLLASNTTAPVVVPQATTTQ